MKKKLLSLIFICVFIFLPNNAKANLVTCGMDLSISPPGSKTVVADWWASAPSNNFYDIWLDFFDPGGLQLVGKLLTVNGFGDSNTTSHTYSSTGSKQVRIKSGNGCDDLYTITIPALQQLCSDTDANNNGGPAPCTYSFVNLNYGVSNVCSGASIPGATVSINKDFGNGTSRSTDGSGYANFGVYANKTVDWTVTATGYSSVSGSVNSGGSGTTVYPALTPTGGCPAAPGAPVVSFTASSTSVGTTSGASTSRTSRSNNPRRDAMHL
jgi:hypothetical protein